MYCWERAKRYKKTEPISCSAQVLLIFPFAVNIAFSAIEPKRQQRQQQQQQQRQHTIRHQPNDIQRMLCIKAVNGAATNGSKNTHIHTRSHIHARIRTHTDKYTPQSSATSNHFIGSRTLYVYAYTYYQLTIWITHTNIRAQSISSWSRTFCSYSACLLCRLLLTMVLSNMRERGKENTHMYTKLLLVPLLLLLLSSSSSFVVASWYFLLFIMHINLNETTEAFVYSCRCYSVHAVDQMN